MADYKFPTEMVELPSQGHFYIDGHPLSTGKIELKYMTAKEEDILTSQNLIEQGGAIDMLLQSLIVNKSINVDDLLIGDKNAVMVASRILGYGKEYEFKINGEEHKTDLTKLEAKKIDFKKYPKGKNEFSFKLPNSERTITFKLLTGKDEKNIDLELKAREKISTKTSSNLTTRFKYIILSVDGKSDKSHINNFVDNEFLSIDSLAFRKHLNQITPDVDMTTTIVGKDGKESEVTIPVTVRFFWPNTEV